MESCTMEPRVGIVFLYDGELFSEMTPVSRAEDYGLLKTHANGHPSFWEELQRTGDAPRDIEYDEVARGRITYDTRKEIFYVFLDRCINERRRAIHSIIDAFGLAGVNTEVLSDSHYRCPNCLSKSSD